MGAGARINHLFIAEVEIEWNLLHSCSPLLHDDRHRMSQMRVFSPYCS